MPLYEYEGPGGKTVLEHRPVDRRDEPLVVDGERYERRTIPRRLMVCTGAQPESTGDRLRKGYYKLEEQGKLQDRPGYLPLNKVKAALAMPD